ncbi:MAG TPA: ABC transporter ATP-binding protein [Dehalococcoidales bacterium]|nr:ABC transporter ATP-binding protein [Dehalococcoidales bacterium]
MLKLIGYLKPFTWTIILIFILLFGQALCDLALPDYMSRIVNIGIQQQGIADPAPRAVRASEMSKILLFVEPDGQAVIQANYRRSDTLSQEEYNQFLTQYPGIASEPVYIRILQPGTTIDELNAIFSRPLMLVASIESRGLMLPPDVPALPPGTDPFQFLADLPEAQKAEMRQVITQSIAALPDNLIMQSAVSYLSSEYRAIGINLSQLQTNYILKIGGYMLLLTLLGTALSVLVGFLAARVAATFARDTRRRLFTRVENFTNKEFDKFSTASLITRSTNDIQQIQMVLVMLLRIVFYAPIIGTGGVIKALGQDVSMSWIIAAAVLMLLVMIIIVFIVAVPRFRKIQALVDRLNLVTREALTGIMVVRAFNNQPYEEKRFDKANVDVTQINLFVQRVMVFLMPAMMLLMNGIMLLVIWFGAIQIDAGRMQVGDMMAFMQYTMLIIMAFVMVSMVFIMLPRAGVSAQRIAEVLETEPDIRDPESPMTFDPMVRGQLEFKKVCFKYPGAEDYVLRDISFSARSGETVAVVGGTGSGKSTLVNLIPRFYDVSEGQILFNRMDIRQVTQHDLRDKIGYVPQQTILFSGDIESNLKFADENATDSDIRKAAAIAQASDFIEASENGYKTDISQGGMNLSGGQKQRLAIARALVKKPDLFIFDDSFSAIDYRTDAALRKALRQETRDSIVLIVAQRISTIMSSDRIVVLEKGRIAGIGTHSELYENCEVYRDLALSQLSKEELA